MTDGIVEESRHSDVERSADLDGRLTIQMVVGDPVVKYA